MGRVFDGLHIVSIIPQNAIKAFYQNRIRGAENDVFHDEVDGAYAMPAGRWTFWRFVKPGQRGRQGVRSVVKEK